MTLFLCKLFIKDYENVEDDRVRLSIGTLSSVVGIVANIVLFCLKLFLGWFSSSIAITSDAFNNLSDMATSVVTLFGYQMASKPADKDHPYGHGRIEYLTSLVIAVVILFVGFELLKDSVSRINSSETIQFSYFTLASLLASIAIKIWLGFFNRSLGVKINNSAMVAVAQDSFSDVLATSATIISLLFSRFTPFSLDGLMGVIVSCFILKAGYDVLKDTLDTLIGQQANEEVVERIKTILLNNERILGIHDLMLHDYGPNRLIGSVHVEVRSDEILSSIHDCVDELESQVKKECNVLLTIHTDPIDIDDEEVQGYRMELDQFVKTLCSGISIHDFRMVKGETHSNLIFDVALSFDCPIDNNIVEEKIHEYLAAKEERLIAVCTIERDF